MTPEVAAEEPDPEPGVRIRPYLRSPSPDGEPVPATAPPADETGYDPEEPSGPGPFVLTAGRSPAPTRRSASKPR